MEAEKRPSETAGENQKRDRETELMFCQKRTVQTSHLLWEEGGSEWN